MVLLEKADKLLGMAPASFVVVVDHERLFGGPRLMVAEPGRRGSCNV
jgi:hypothetical protein